jgi:hypothetical protein
LALRGGTHLLLCWPALSFGIVSVAYLTNDARWFGKRTDGSRFWLATAVLLPYLIYVQSVWLLQISLSCEPAINYVNDSLALSRRLLPREVPDTVAIVCDLTCEFVDPKPLRSNPGYRCHPVLDAGACSAAELIDLARRLPPSNGNMLLIHCANGHGRTGMFAAVWLLTHGFVTTVDDAITMLQNARPGIGLRSRQRRLVVEALSKLQESDEPSIEPKPTAQSN